MYLKDGSIAADSTGFSFVTASSPSQMPLFRVQQRFALLMDSFFPQLGQIAPQDHRLKRNL
jgi:hypothetical protein